MEDAVAKLQKLLNLVESYFSVADEGYLQAPYRPEKWSRKQILGHLTDSALNNLTRFTEIGYRPQPYAYREYHQAELVKINNYQQMDTGELLQLWLSLNRQILRVMQSVTPERLALKVKFADGSLTDLGYIMRDYPDHMEHHINQILS